MNPSSPLVKQLKPPAGFDVKRTPLVSFRRVDLLFDPSELDAIHKTMHVSSFSSPNNTVPPTLFGPDASESYNLSPDEYLSLFTTPLPDANYKVLLLSTAGHWTTASLPGARDPDDIQAEATNPAVFKTFKEAVRVWSAKVTTALLVDRLSEYYAGVRSKERQVLIRAYLPGHEYDCHKEEGPLTEVREFSREWYNWSWVGRMNEAFRVSCFCYFLIEGVLIGCGFVGGHSSGRESAAAILERRSSGASTTRRCKRLFSISPAYTNPISL